LDRRVSLCLNLFISLRLVQQSFQALHPAQGQTLNGRERIEYVVAFNLEGCPLKLKAIGLDAVNTPDETTHTRTIIMWMVFFPVPGHGQLYMSEAFCEASSKDESDLSTLPGNIRHSRHSLAGKKEKGSNNRQGKELLIIGSFAT